MLSGCSGKFKDDKIKKLDFKYFLQVSKSVLTEFFGVLVSTAVTSDIRPIVVTCNGDIEDGPAVEQTQSTDLYNIIIERVDQSPLLVWSDHQSISFAVNLTVYGEDEELSGNLIEIATIDGSGLRATTAEYIKPARRFFRIGVTESIPWNYIRRDLITAETVLDHEGKPVWEGYCIDFIEKLAEVLDFDYELVPPRSGTFGSRKADNSWDGLVGGLMTGVLTNKFPLLNISPSNAFVPYRRWTLQWQLLK